MLSILEIKTHSFSYSVKPVFHFNRIVAKRTVFHCFVHEHPGRTNDTSTIENATFRYDTVEVENGLNAMQQFRLCGIGTSKGFV